MTFSAYHWRVPLRVMVALLWLLGGAVRAELSPEAPPPASAPAQPKAHPAGGSGMLEAPALRGVGDVPQLDPPVTSPAEDVGMGWLLLRTLVVLGIVVISIYVTLNYGLRKLMGLKGLPGNASVVAVVERIPLDQKRMLFLVKAGGEYLLVGGGEQSLSLVAKLDGEQVERLQREKPSSPMTVSPFLQKLLSRRGGTPPPSA